MIALLQDIIAFAEQFIPSPITLFRAYQFSPADLAVGHVCLAPGRSPTWKDDDTILSTIDVLSYNINNVAARSPTRVRRILRAIFSSGADVILLQETNPAWEDLIRDEATALQFRYSYFHHPGANDRAAGGIAILSQYPLGNVKILDFMKVIPGSVFPALTCEVKVPIEVHRAGELEILSDSSSIPTVTISIANVHLRPPVELDGSAWLDTARKTEPVRINEMKELIQSTASVKAESIMASESDQHPLDIIGGDFNEGDNVGSLAYLVSLGYIDALQQHVSRSKETHTWPFARNLWTLRKRLDHILCHGSQLTTVEGLACSIELQCLGCGVVTGYENGASDHQPVLARFAFVKK